MKYVKWFFISVFVVTVARVVLLMTSPEFQQKQRDEQQAKAAEKRANEEAVAESWAKWIKDAQEKNAAAQKEPTDPNWERGFEVGYRAGMVRARGGSVRPEGSKLDAMARAAATSANVEEGVARSQFERAYPTGFDYGWNKGK